MKKLFFLIIVVLTLFSCGSYRSFDLNKLTTGMSKAEVVAKVGRPERVLAMNQTGDGIQEVLEYRTSSNEVYALEFWNDYLTGYEFQYDDINYVAPLYPPMYIPDYGRPIIVVPNHNRPNGPGISRPPYRPQPPSRPNRPGNNNNRPNRPEVNRPQTRPTPGVGPSTRPTTRPSVNSTNQGSSARSTRER